MSEENVEVVRKSIDVYNAFMRGDLSRKEAEAGVLFSDPQVEWHWHAGQTFPDEPQHLRGPQEIIGFWEQLRSAWVDVAVDPLEFVELPWDRVLVSQRQTGRGRESGVPIEYHFFTVYTTRDGRVRKAEIFRHRTGALEAAGLRE